MILSLSKNSFPSIDEAALILIRHGESLWNAKNLFTGCVDVPLTKKGVEEAIEAGKRISNIPVDMVYTSALIRAQMTAMLAITQHRCKKVSYFYLHYHRLYFLISIFLENHTFVVLKSHYSHTTIVLISKWVYNPSSRRDI